MYATAYGAREFATGDRVAPHELASRTHAHARETLTDPTFTAALRQTLALGAAASRELIRSADERRDLVRTFRELEQVGVAEIAIRPDAARGGLTTWTDEILRAGEEAHAPHTGRLHEMERERETERVRLARERAAERDFGPER